MIKRLLNSVIAKYREGCDELYIIHVVKRDKLSSTIMKNLNKLKMDDS